jgi:hypothetical protein
MYATDLPKWVSTLPKAAFERDQGSPHYPHCLPRHESLLLHYRHPDTTRTPQSGTLNALLRRDSLHTHLQQTRPALPHATRIVFVTT